MLTVGQLVRSCSLALEGSPVLGHQVSGDIDHAHPGLPQGNLLAVGEGCGQLADDPGCAHSPVRPCVPLSRQLVRGPKASGSAAQQQSLEAGLLLKLRLSCLKLPRGRVAHG